MWECITCSVNQVYWLRLGNIFKVAFISCRYYGCSTIFTSSIGSLAWYDSAVNGSIELYINFNQIIVQRVNILFSYSEKNSGSNIQQCSDGATAMPIFMQTKMNSIPILKLFTLGRTMKYIFLDKNYRIDPKDIPVHSVIFWFLLNCLQSVFPTNIQ